MILKDLNKSQDIVQTVEDCSSLTSSNNFKACFEAK